MISIPVYRRVALQVLTSLLVFTSTNSFLDAQEESPLLKTCLNHAASQMELNTCAADDAKRAENEASTVYKQLLARHHSDSMALAKIKAFEKSWIAYRSAYLAATFPAEDKQYSYGSIFPMEWDLLYAEITRSHSKMLYALLRDENIQ